MVKKIINIIVAFTLVLAGVFAYGGGGAGSVVFKVVDSDSEGFGINSFDFKGSNIENVVVDCKNEVITFDKNGRDKDEDIDREDCSFDKLSIDGVSEFEVYVSDEKYGVKADDFGIPFTIVIDGKEFNGVTNFIRSFPKEEEKEAKEEEIVFENVSIVTNVTNVSEVIAINTSFESNYTLLDVNTTVINETESEGFFTSIFSWFGGFFLGDEKEEEYFNESINVSMNNTLVNVSMPELNLSNITLEVNVSGSNITNTTESKGFFSWLFGWFN